MRKLLFCLCLLGIISICSAHTIKPIKKKIGKLTLSIDPRMEALSVIQTLSKYPVIRRTSSYSQKIETYFKAYDTLNAVRLTDQLKNHFTHDAPVTFMLYLSQPEDLKQQIPYSQYLIRRAGGKQNIEDYRVAIKEFIQKSRFKDFWNQNQSIYEQILEKTVSACQDIDWVKALEEYYNEAHNSYNIIISPSFAGGYGPRIKAPNGKWDIYACLSSTDVSDNGIPYLNKEGLMYFLWHEFSHSYVNPEFEKYETRIYASEKLFEPLRQIMTRQAYNQWATCVNEHVVRAIHLRLIDLYLGHTAYLQKLNQELSKGFLYIEPLLQKLTEYEELKKTSPVTFSEFVPRIIDVLDSLAKTDYQKQLNVVFKGPINSVSGSHKTAIIYPTNIQDSVIRNSTEKYVRTIYEKFFNTPSNILLADTSALQKTLAEYSIIAYGSISGNLFLSHYKSVFPFTIHDQELFADQSYTQTGLKIISCQPNPQNKKLGMTIYSAISDQDIPGINNVFHGPEDYVIFLDRNHILKKGYYFNKTSDKWTFQE